MYKSMSETPKEMVLELYGGTSAEMTGVIFGKVMGLNMEGAKNGSGVFENAKIANLQELDGTEVPVVYFKASYGGAEYTLIHDGVPRFAKVNVPSGINSSFSHASLTVMRADGEKVPESLANRISELFPEFEPI